VATAAADAKKPGRQHEVHVWHAATGERLVSWTGPGQVFNLAFGPDGKNLALVGADGLVAVRDVASRRLLLQVPGHKGEVAAVAFSPDGHRLATGGLEDRTVKIWELAGHAAAPATGGRPLFTLPAPPALCDLAFSPDGHRLAGISRDLVKVWDTESGHEALTLRGSPQRHLDPAFNPRVVFSPDGRRLAGSNWDETISVWEAEPAPDEVPLPRFRAARRQAADERAAFWHLQEGEYCLAHNHQFAAGFHLKCLARVGLSEPLQERKKALLKHYREQVGPRPKE
jgi:WD40 repeat protein